MMANEFVKASQEELGIYLSCLEPTLAYNLPLLIPCADEAKAKAAMEKVLAAHPGMNVRFRMDKEGNLLKAIVPTPLQWQSEDVATIDRESLVRPFELLDAPLYRCDFLRCPTGNCLFVDFHHINMDGFSLTIFLREFGQAYDGGEVVAESYTTIDNARAQAVAREDAKRYQEDKAFYENEFGDLDLDSLPTQDKGEGSPRYGNIDIELPLLKEEEIASFLTKAGIRRSSFFLAAFGLTLGQFSFAEEAKFMTVHNGRSQDAKGSFGMFVRTLPVYMNGFAEGDVKAFLQGVDKKLADERAHDTYGYNEIASELSFSGDVLFAYQGDYYYSLTIDGKTQDVEVVPVPDGKENFAFELFHKDHGYFVRCEYRADLYEEDSVRHLMACFCHLCLELMAKDRLEAIEPASEEDRKLVFSYNDRSLEGYDLDHDFVDSIRTHMQEKPDAPALVCGETTVTYGELEDLSGRLSDYLIDQGYKPNQIVAILIKRNVNMGIASLGVLRAGLAYQPLDPGYPDERLSFMVQDSEAVLLVADRGLETRLSGYEGPILYTDEIPSLPRKHHPEPKNDPNDLYIMLYTSGSTGKPKGVQLEHHNLNAYMQYLNRFFDFQEDDRIGAYASYGFDANMYDMFMALCNGFPLYIIDEEMRLDLKRLNAYFEENKITRGMFTTQVGRQFVESMDNHSLRSLMVGGEKLVPVEPPKGYTLINGYGPTECTITITFQKVEQNYYRVPIGQGYPINHLYVLDKKMRPLPYGVPGYLYCAGPQVARGYKNRPEENAKAFLTNPFEGGMWQRMYFTGDVVRFLKDGTVDFIGRKDGQVKIRGFRIETTEVERVLRDYPGITDATVQAFPAPSGGLFLAGYYVADTKLDQADIKRFIGERKPYYMVPEALMQLDAIPLNQNSKVNKRALPEPKREQAEIVPPEGKVEEAIHEVAKKVLGYDAFSVTEDLFMGGLTSISSIRFLSLVSEATGKDLTTKDLRANPTIRGLAALVGGAQDEAVDEDLPFYPLTKTQEGIFVEMMAHPDSTIYNIPLIYELDPQIDVEELKKALQGAIANHPGLLGHLQMQGADVVMVPNRQAEVKVDIVEGELPDPFVTKPYDLFKGPFYQARIYVGATKKYLYLDTHHIASDGSSLAVLLEDLNLLMAGQKPGPEKRSPYAIALREKKQATPEEVAKQKEYYGSFLSGVDSPSLPRKEYELSDKPTPLTFDLPLRTPGEEISAYLKENGIGPNAFFNAAFAYALAKWNGNEDALFASIYSGRDDVASARTVTMLVKTLPVYVSIDKTKDKLSFIKEMETQLHNSEDRTLYSFAEASHDFGVKSDVMFAYQGDGFLPDSIGGKPAKMVTLLGDEAKAPFSVDCLLGQDGYRLHFEYPANMYREETMECFGDLFDCVVDSFLTQGTLGEIVLCSDEMAQKLDKYNETDAELPNTSYLGLLAEQVKANPDKPAIIGIDETLTYREFDKRTNQIANALIKRGVRPDDKVVTMTRRIANAYVARQGVLKAGAAFVPVDPAYPDERILYIASDSEARFVLTTRDLYEEKKDAYVDISFLIIEDILKEESAEAVNVDIDLSSLAYCIYTSGSTGKPKGVMIEHRSLLNYVTYCDHNVIAHEFVDYCKVSCSLASLSFDLSIEEEFVPLAAGLTVMIASEDEILNPLALAKRMLANHVDILTTTPSYVNNVLDIEEVMKAFRNLKVLEVGAEALPAVMVEKIRKQGMNCLIHNGYGPTEATVCCTLDVVDSPRITIGFPLNNVQTYIIDAEGRRLPFGAVGELLIGGTGVARGYIHRDDLTKEKFIDFNGKRAYRSGDLARLNYDGRIEFFGRKDNQVKLRGLRVELDEIENTLNSYPGVSRSVVLVKESPEEGQFLVGYYLSEQEIPVAELKAHLSKTLTPYMVPKIFVHLTALPMTQNGKIDKKALPEPTLTKEAGAAKVRLPRNETQQAIYDIFVHVLGVTSLSIDDDFFDLGGSSLSASKVTMLAMEKGLPISYSDVFDNPTVADLAALVLAQGKKEQKQEETLQTSEKGLEFNVISEVDGICKDKDFASIVLTGANGFLGIHILREILERGTAKVTALVRGGKGVTGRERLEALFAYYFDTTYADLFDKRLFVIETDVTSSTLGEDLRGCDFDLLINCAAIVKHFAADDSIERVNLGGVKNLIEVALEHKARMVQVSTLSVAGENVGGKFPKEKRIHEDEIFFGQDISNKYINSKIKAEEAMIEAINDRGLDGKVVRVGNLMGRARDGEFQINSGTNNFMASLKAYASLGVFPVSGADSTIDFSPIDEVAKTILLLASTPSRYTLFHSANSHEVELGDVIEALNDYGFHIDIVKDEVFSAKLAEFMKDESKNMIVSSLISYSSSDTSVTRDYILSDNSFTIKALYRLGYKWPITDKRYLARAIASLATLGFFD